MEINEIIKINEKFGGTLINKSNLEFDLNRANNQKNVYKKNAYIIRGIINGHPFLDGNKRTALYIISNNFRKNRYKCNKTSLTNGIIDIARNNINSIKVIEGKLRKWAIKK